MKAELKKSLALSVENLRVLNEIIKDANRVELALKTAENELFVEVAASIAAGDGARHKLAANDIIKIKKMKRLWVVFSDLAVKIDKSINTRVDTYSK